MEKLVSSKIRILKGVQPFLSHVFSIEIFSQLKRKTTKNLNFKKKVRLYSIQDRHCFLLFPLKSPSTQNMEIRECQHCVVACTGPCFYYTTIWRRRFSLWTCTAHYIGFGPLTALCSTYYVLLSQYMYVVVGAPAALGKSDAAFQCNNDKDYHVALHTYNF